MAKKKNTASQAAVWVILILLIVGLAGFGATNFGGSVNTVASVGDREIKVDRYARALSQEINRLSQQFGTPLSFAQAQMFGIDRAVLSRLLTGAALEDEAAALGISAGDDAVREALLGVTAFQGADGTFDREGYRFTLEQSNLTEKEFEESLRADLARDLLTRAVSGAAGMPDSYIDAILTYREERRDVTWAVLTESDLNVPIAEPTDAELRAYWEANADSFMLPETRDITYAWLTPEMVAGTIEGDDEVLRALYDEREADYNRPERRLAERLIFATRDAAEAAMAVIESGEKTFEDLVTERDLTLADVDLGDVSRADLGEAADAVFGLDGPGMAGPVETDLGFALFRMNGILAAQVTSFEDARADLLVEYRGDAARRAIADRINSIDDLLAGGATLEDLGTETDLETGQIDWTADTSDGIAAYSEFREAAQAAEVGDFPEVIEAADGAIFALRVNEITEPRVQPFDEARAAVAADWRRQTTVEALAEQARALAEDLKDATVEAPIPQEDPQPPAEAPETSPEVTVAPPASEAPAEMPDGGETPEAAGDGTETPVATDGDPEAPAPDAAPEGETAEGEAAPEETPAADDTATGDTVADGTAPEEAAPGVAPETAPEMAEDTPAPSVTYVTEVGLGREGFIPDTPAGFVETVFGMTSGEIRVIEGTSAAYIVRLDAITPPDLADPELVAQAGQIRARLAESVGDDILNAYAAAIQTDAGISINQAALTAVHSQLLQ